ncbi:hypothetical protein LINPERPRIM_LOCUS21003 [Linum perenne]
MGYDRVQFECDALAVVQAINSNIPDNTEFGDIIARCRSTLLSNPQFEVCFARRSRNTVAHSLARRSILEPSPTFGVDFPIWLCNSLTDICLEANH